MIDTVQGSQGPLPQPQRPATGAAKSERAPAPAASAEPAPADAVQRPDGEEALRAAIQAIDPEFNPDTSRLSIDLDADLNRFIYRSIDKVTGEVVGQYPAEDILRTIKFLREVEGLVVDERA